MSLYLVTGGSGFCGFEMVKLLLEKKQKVRVLDIEKMPENLKVDFIKADIRDRKAVEDAVKGVDYVIHTVAKVPISKAGKEFWNVNVEGTRNVMEAALKSNVKKVVHISSSSVQMNKKNPVGEYAPFHPVGIYARSKLDAEYVCQEYIKKGLCIDIIRPRTVIGQGRLGIFDILFDWIADGKNVYTIGSGENTIQFLHVKDLAVCTYLSSISKGNNIFNVGSRECESLREDLNYLIKHAGTSSKVVGIPVVPSIIVLAMLDFLHLSPLASWHYLTYHKDFYFDNKNAKDILGWKPRYSNKEILVESYDNYILTRKDRHSFGTSHRKGLKQGILSLVKRLS